MDPFFLIYVLGTLLLAVLGVFVAAVFLRYRFKGDSTPTILAVFAVLFVASVIITLSI